MQRIYLHGLGQTSKSWERIILRSEAPECGICPDLPKILQGKDATYQNLYRSVSEICSRFEGKIDLCGLSLGGVLALNYSIENPQKVNALVLIAPQYKMPKNLLMVQNLLFHFMPESMFRQTGFDKQAFIRLCRTMMKLDFSSSLSKITCPTLVLCGERDSANKKAAIKLADKLKHGEFRIIPGSGHEVNADTPEKLSEILFNFYRCTK